MYFFCGNDTKKLIILLTLKDLIIDREQKKNFHGNIYLWGLNQYLNIFEIILLLLLQTRFIFGVRFSIIYFKKNKDIQTDKQKTGDNLIFKTVQSLLQT